MFNKSKLSILFISAATSLLFFSGIASAHVTVKPTTSTPGAWETYTIKVPVEKETPTTKLTLKIPTEVDFKQYQPVPDWEVTTEKDTSDKITTITWTATGDGIAAGEFQTFNFVAQNPEEDASLAWDAYQYYSDGSIVEWTGEEGSDLPHAITLVSSSETANTESDDHSHDHSHNTSTPAESTDQDTVDQNASDENNSSSSLNIMAMIISIVALISSIVALTKTRKRQ